MPRYLIDVNLPRYFSEWNSEDYIHQYDIDSRGEDQKIWIFAREQNLTIITKDSDFSHRILLTSPPPRVIHIRFGNLSMNAFHGAIANCWKQVLEMSETHKLVTVYLDRIEGVR